MKVRAVRNGKKPVIPMTLEQEILNTLRALPAEKQQAVLDHARHLRGEVGQPRQPRESGRGLWADLNISLSAEDIDEAQRQVRRWMASDHPPSLTTIENWCKKTWDYCGTFEDDPSLSISRRWERCRRFLITKGLDGRSDWLESLPQETAARFRNQYRGEKLELEILPFKIVPFEDFFKYDPVAARLPVEDLISRVATRFACPTNARLKARFLMAAAFHRAFNKVWDDLGCPNTMMLLNWFERLHLLFMELQTEHRPTDRSRILHSLRSQYSWGDDFRDAAEWIFDDNAWAAFPAMLSARFMADKRHAGSAGK